MDNKGQRTIWSGEDAERSHVPHCLGRLAARWSTPILLLLLRLARARLRLSYKLLGCLAVLDIAACQSPVAASRDGKESQGFMFLERVSQ